MLDNDVHLIISSSPETFKPWTKRVNLVYLDKQISLLYFIGFVLSQHSYLFCTILIYLPQYMAVLSSPWLFMKKLSGVGYD